LKKSVYYIFFLYFALQSIFAQPTVRFNKRYNYSDTNTVGLSTNVFKAGKGYLLTGIVSSAALNLYNAVGITKTDSVGNVEWQKITRGHNNFNFTNNSFNQFFIQLKNKNILVTGQFPIYTSDYTRGFLARVNQETGDTLWVKEYTQPGDTNFLFCSVELADSSIITVGYAYTLIGLQLFNRPFVMKVYKHGNYKWHKYLWNKTSYYVPTFCKLINVNDKDFIVNGVHSYTSPQKKGFLIRFDTNGVVQYHKLVSHTAYSYTYFNDLVPLKNGNYLCSGAVRTTLYQSSDYWHPWLYEFNPLTGNEVKSKMYATEKINAHGFDVLYQDGNTGNIFATGAEWVLNKEYANGTFYKFNENLDSLFSHYYESGQKGTFVCGSMLRANDMGFALAMQIYPAIGAAKYCLLKTDSLGCYDTLNCFATPTVGAINSANELTTTQPGIKVYPNPFNEQISIELLNSTAANEYEVWLLNTMGMVIKKEKPLLPANTSSIQFATLNLPKGFYVMQIYFKNKLTYTQKIFKD
jgi:hypothetical protein